MTATDVRTTIDEFYRDRLAMRQRHVAGAEAIASYEFNNTYQYVIAREDTQLRWLQDALDELGERVDDVGDTAMGAVTGGEGTIATEDARLAQEFVDRWRPRVEALEHARHRKMLNVILGETLEHKRFFDQVASGRTDLLGQRSGIGTGGGVLSRRWSGD